MQNKGVEKYLTFEMLEDVMSLPYAERERYIERAGVLRIGPLTEYAFHDYDNAEDVLGIRSSGL